MTARDLLEGGPIPLVVEIRAMIDQARPEQVRIDPARVIGIGELAAALGTNRVTIIRWVDAGKIPPPEREPGTWRRWTLDVAIKILKDAGRKVPEAWEK